MYRTLITTLILALLLASPLRAEETPLSQVLIEGEDWKQVAEGFKFTEGPAVDRDGNVYFTDIPNNKIHKLDLASGKLSLFAENTFATNGLMFGPDGRLYGCQNGKQRIVAFDTTGNPMTIAEGAPSNDLVVTGKGDIYFTDPANHKVWHIPSASQPRVVDEGIERPNGIILWPDQQTLVVADSAGDKLWSFRVEANGDLTNKQPYYKLQLPPLATRSGADGMTVDSGRRLYCTSVAGLQVFDIQGRVSGVIAKPQTGPLSNAVFAGPKLDVLVVTAGDKVFSRKTKATGVRYFSVPMKTVAAAATQTRVATAVAAPVDPQLAIQGEYVGQADLGDGKKTYGVQLVALGQGKYLATRYTGGLPGGGAVKASRIEGAGETKDGVVTITFDGSTAQVAGQSIKIKTDKLAEAGELKRIERTSPTAGAKPPQGAVVLFDGSSADAFQGGRMTEDKLLMEGVTSKQKFGSGTLHIEFQTPFQPNDLGQKRGNSGCYLQGRFEVQILDSFGLLGKNNECGGIYTIRDPDINMCLPPQAWQTYDIDFTAAGYDAAGMKTTNAKITVRHNGVIVQENVELPKITTAAPVKEGPEDGPLYLQNHGNPVRFRNIWFVPK